MHEISKILQLLLRRITAKPCEDKVALIAKLGGDLADAISGIRRAPSHTGHVCTSCWIRNRADLLQLWKFGQLCRIMKS